MGQRVVIIGGGAAGMSAASAARRTDPGLEIVVLEAGGHAAYGLCGIPYYLSRQVREAEDLIAYQPSFFRERRGIDLRLRTRATRIDPDRNLVHFTENGRDQRLTYHRLIVTAGAEPVRPGVPGLTAERVFTIRSLADAIGLRGLLDAGRVGRALVIGAGYIGLELAEALVTRGVKVTVAERLPRAMAGLDEEMSELVASEVRRHGVDLRLGTSVTALRPASDSLEVVLASPAGTGGAGEAGPAPDRAAAGTELVAADIVILAAGVRPAADLAAAAGAATGPAGALTVDDRMRTSLPGVLAAGDCVAPFHQVLGRPAYVPLGPAANRAGRVAGTVAAGGDASFPGVVGTAVAKVFDLAVARTGLTLGEALAEGLDAMATDVTGKSRAKYYPGTGPVRVRLVHRRDGLLLGAQMIGAGDGVAKRIDVAALALQARLSIDDLAAADFAYAPPYAPVTEPVALAAQAAQWRRVTGAASPAPAELTAAAGRLP